MQTNVYDLYVVASAPTTGNKPSQNVHTGIDKWALVTFGGTAGTFSMHLEGSEDEVAWFPVGPAAITGQGEFEYRENIRFVRATIDNVGSLTSLSVKTRVRNVAG